MKTMFAFLAFALTLLFGACCGSSTTIIKCKDGYAAVQDCGPIIKYSGTNFEIGEFSIPGLGGLAIKGFKVDQNLIQQATGLAQITDLDRVSLCQLQNSISITCDPDRAKYLMAMYSLKSRIEALAVIYTSHYDTTADMHKAIAAWIGSTAATLQDLNTKMKRTSDSTQTFLASSTDEKQIENGLSTAYRILNLDSTKTASLDSLKTLDLGKYLK